MLYSCKNCECKLWSDYHKNTGVCPECVNPEIEDCTDLEEVLEFILDKTE